ncbi:ribonuclease pancreatic-like [Rhinatrema bivittatum]|uniref:ribonuclease pancreatic-like n=1 Tax=Rhinatrema bivittatum TaxID=194408 RepID=UPI001126529D|nr:ribonuclease pancreatic-like [Rhinatrema bivittatum]
MRKTLLNVGPLLSLLFLLPLLFPPSSPQNYDKFKKKHIDASGRSINRNYCTEIIRRREIKGQRGKCKVHNTFIRVSEDEILRECHGRQDNINITSERPYNLIDCRHSSKRRERWPNCTYNTTQNLKHRICITCEENEPVHFQRFCEEDPRLMLGCKRFAPDTMNRKCCLS